MFQASQQISNTKIVWYAVDTEVAIQNGRCNGSRDDKIDDDDIMTVHMMQLNAVRTANFIINA